MKILSTKLGWINKEIKFYNLENNNKMKKIIKTIILQMMIKTLLKCFNQMQCVLDLEIRWVKIKILSKAMINSEKSSK